MEGFNFFPNRGLKDRVTNSSNKFVWFFQIFLRKFWKLIQLNFIYILFCIPVITIGPATCALIKITKCFIIEQPVYIFSDFFSEFKKSFKGTFLIGIFNVLFVISVGLGVFYYLTVVKFPWYIAAVFAMCALIITFMLFYIYVMSSCVELSAGELIFNALILAFAELPINLLTLFLYLLVVVPVILFFPYSIIFLLLFTCSFVAFIVTFNIYPIIRKRIIKPYYDQMKQEIPSDRVYSELEVAAELKKEKKGKKSE